MAKFEVTLAWKMRALALALHLKPRTDEGVDEFRGLVAERFGRLPTREQVREALRPPKKIGRPKKSAD
jgi:hypothetical protein